MATPDAPQNDPRNDPQHDTTFDTTTDDTTTDDTTQLEQTVQSDTTQRFGTGQSETTEQLDTTDATRAIGVEEERSSTDLFGNPVHRDDDATATAPATAAATGSDDRDWPPVLPERPSGPHAPAIVLGLVCLVVAGIIVAQELGDLTVDWGDIGPLGIVVVGAVLVLFGLVGLLTSRRSGKTG